MQLFSGAVVELDTFIGVFALSLFIIFACCADFVFSVKPKEQIAENTTRVRSASLENTLQDVVVYNQITQIKKNVVKAEELCKNKTTEEIIAIISSLQNQLSEQEKDYEFQVAIQAYSNVLLQRDI